MKNPGSLKYPYMQLIRMAFAAGQPLFKKIFKENGWGPFSLNAKGVIDNDYYSYTAFEIVCSEKEIKRKEYDFNGEPSDDDSEGDWDDRMIEYEGKEEKAFEELAKASFEKIDVDEIYYDEDEYDAALEAFEDINSTDDFEDEDDFDDDEE